MPYVIALPDLTHLPRKIVKRQQGTKLLSDNPAPQFPGLKYLGKTLGPVSQHSYHSRSHAIEVRRATLRDLEQATDPNDPAYLELRGILLLKIASFEAEQIESGMGETSS